MGTYALVLSRTLKGLGLSVGYHDSDVMISSGVGGSASVAGSNPGVGILSLAFTQGSSLPTFPHPHPPPFLPPLCRLISVVCDCVSSEFL